MARTRMGSPVHSWAAPLYHPLPLAAALLLALNDQVLKPSCALTPPLLGKLSDVCGLFVLPIVVVALARLLARAIVSRSAPPRLAAVQASVTRIAATVALLASGAGFVAATLSTRFNALLGRIWIDKLMDPSDLWALGALVPSAAWIAYSGRRREPSVETAAPRQRCSRVLALVAVLLACAATQPPRRPRAYPVWQFSRAAPRHVAGTTLDAWVSKSGKTGCGVTVHLSPRAAPLRLEHASLHISGGAVISARGLPRVVPAGAEPTHVYLSFAFDNEAAWNAGRRRGELKLVVVSRGQRETLHIAARHVQLYPTYHRFVRRGRGDGVQARDPAPPGGAPR